MTEPVDVSIALLSRNEAMPDPSEVLQRFRSMMASRQADELDENLLQHDEEGLPTPVEPPPIPSQSPPPLPRDARRLE